MSSQMAWTLVGFGIAMLFVFVYYILKTRGFKFFWYHPIFAGIVLLLILYLLESFFADVSTAEVQDSWSMMTVLTVLFGGAAAVFFLRSFLLRRKK